ncbi:MAG: hypothetical protein R3F61_07375 [Myxococcota bacterium]
MDIHTTETSFGQLIVALYDEYLEIYGDADLASVATAATLNELLSETVTADDAAEAA